MIRLSLFQTSITCLFDRRNYYIGLSLLIICMFTSVELLWNENNISILSEAYLLNTVSASFFYCRIWLLIASFFLVVFWKIIIDNLEISVSKSHIFIFSLFALFLILSRALQYPFCVDDTYIYFRYIKNFVNSGSMEYNIGESILGITSHLYLWIISVLAWLTQTDNFPLLVRNLVLILSLINYFGIFFYLKLIGLDIKLSILGSVLYATSYYQITQATYGMESTLLLSLIILLIISLKAKSYTSVAVTSIMIFLCRPEGIFILITTFIYSIVRHGYRKIFIWCFLSIFVLAYFYWVFNTYGTVIPHSIIAKNIIYKIEPFSALQGIANYFVQVSNYESFSYSIKIFLMVGIFIFSSWMSRHEITLLFYVGCCFILLFFFAWTNPLMFAWYYSWFSLLPVLILPVTVARISEYYMKYKSTVRRILVVVILFFSAIIYLEYPRSHFTIFGSTIRQPFFSWDPTKHRLLLYQKAAEYLNVKTSGKSIVAVSEDGIFGYIYKGNIVTLDGLALREVSQFYPLQKNQYYVPFAISPNLIERTKPEYVVFLDVFAFNSILKDPFFLKNYSKECFWPIDLWGGKGMYLYKSLSDNNNF